MMRRDCLFPISYCLLKEEHARARSEVEFAIKNRQLAIGNRQSAFSFIEVLFAVILLGIGFIMIAAVFPVAIQQTSVVSDETQATSLARDAIKKIQAIADTPGASTLFPITNTSVTSP